MQDDPHDHPLDRPRPPRSLAERAMAWITWFGLGRLLAGAAAIVMVAAASWWLFRAGPPPAEAGLPMAARSPAATVPPSSSTDPIGATSSTIVVHVSGQVARPGVVSLPKGARVIDAVAASGGATEGAEVDRLNLAAVLADGAKVHVPAAGEAATVQGAASGSAESGPLDLNSATAEQLDQLPGVGPATAAAIIAYRQTHGPFATVDDLGQVRGIGPAKLESLRPLVTV